MFALLDDLTEDWQIFELHLLNGVDQHVTAREKYLQLITNLELQVKALAAFVLRILALYDPVIRDLNIPIQYL
jgi:hypothetical protein